MPVADTNGPEEHTSTKEEAPATEIFLAEADDQSGPVDADIAHLAEQRAMHMLLRYQTQAVKHSTQTSTNTADATTILPPVAPPVSLYANLPQEWPLARLSVQVRHISVLLRVTLYRRVAELNFRGVDFRTLPREVMRNIVYDFNNIGGELARRLASLFAFLKPDTSAGTQADTLGLALYAEPAYWLYGLLSYCAKACESKIEEANGTPVWKAKEEGGTPDIEATGKTLALMQTVVMSFGRNQSLGKPDLPIHHIHVYFPVQFVHKLVARMKTDLLFTEITPEDGKEYKHNSESETNSPCIVVGTYECPCPSNTFASLPYTPNLAGAYEQGLLDGNLGQMVSFQSTYKSILRIEVPVWPEVLQAALPPAQAKCQTEPRRTALQAAIAREQNRAVGPTPQTQEGTPIEPASAKKAEEEAEEEDEETYVAPEGQGCFSFRQSLLLRARDTYAARCIGNKYEVISRWLLTGLAVVLSRQNWQLLAKRGTLTATPQDLLKRYYQIGYPAGLKDKTALPYALLMHNAITDAEWQRRVGWYCHSRYLPDMDALYAERAESRFDTFYSTMDLTNPIQAMQYDQTEAEQDQSNRTN